MPLWRDGARERRRYNLIQTDTRAPFQRDRDRILYSSAFRRLAGITQIVRAGEAEVFHTRQQHTLKVAQIARRLAERCINEDKARSDFHGVSADVVEAAALAHDLGHPPFGHIGEETLHDLVSLNHDEDGFEGNAQSFRILVRLSLRFDERPGLDLTRASLAACLKYPWFRDINIVGRKTKWGAYRSDKDDFCFAREMFCQDTKTAEAEIMDWADDVAYSVHDMEDLHRCSLIPWTAIKNNKDIRRDIADRAANSWFKAPADASDRLYKALDRVLKLIVEVYDLDEPYDGSRLHRTALRALTSYINGRIF